MNKYKKTIYSIAFGLLIFSFCSCKKELNPPVETNCDQVVIVNAKEFEEAPKNRVKIEELSIEGDCLKINFSASGCDGNTWKVKLIDSGLIAESYPEQRTLRLSLENAEDCMAYISKEISFDIRKLQIKGNNKVSLHFADKGILYEY